MKRPGNDDLLISDTFCPPEHRTLDFFSGFGPGEPFELFVFLDGKKLPLSGRTTVSANAETWNPELLYGPVMRDFRITLDSLGLPDVEAEEYSIQCSSVTIFRKDTFRTANRVLIVQISSSLFLPFSKDWDRLKTNEVPPDNWDEEERSLEKQCAQRFVRPFGKHPLMGLRTIRQRNCFTATPQGYALSTPKPITEKTVTLFPEYTETGMLRCVTLYTKTEDDDLIHPCLADYGGLPWT